MISQALRDELAAADSGELTAILTDAFAAELDEHPLTATQKEAIALANLVPEFVDLLQEAAFLLGLVWRGDLRFGSAGWLNHEQRDKVGNILLHVQQLQAEVRHAS